MNITNITPANLDAEGFFCYMSKRNSPGYKLKEGWLKERFDEGMVIKKLQLPERGFIEYIPAEFAWRPVNAPGYMFIHCLWVVGKSKKRGLASLLINQCIEDAKRKGFKGVCMLTSSKVWLINNKILLKNGFQPVAKHSPFDLMVKKFTDAPDPEIIDNFDPNLQKCADGITVFTSGQCPYMFDAVKIVVDFSQNHGLQHQVVELKSRGDVLDRAPSPYGTFSIVYNRQLLAYYYQLEKDLLKRLPEMGLKL